jgi:peptidyl-tRNA hydrolase
MRNDLGSLSTGRAAAQASHAANAFIYKYGDRADVKEWQNQTVQGFGTAIVLGTTIDQITDLHKIAFHDKYPTEFITDPDYVISIPSEILPIVMDSAKSKIEQSPIDPNKYLYHRREVTCCYIFGDKEKLAELLGDLPLYS